MFSFGSSFIILFVSLSHPDGLFVFNLLSTFLIPTVVLALIWSSTLFVSMVILELSLIFSSKYLPPPSLVVICAFIASAYISSGPDKQLMSSLCSFPHQHYPPVSVENYRSSRTCVLLILFLTLFIGWGFSVLFLDPVNFIFYFVCFLVSFSRLTSLGISTV